MSNLKRINPPQIKDPSEYGFTQAVTVPAGSKLVYIAGQGGADENGSYGSFSEQMERAFANLNIVLEAAGATPEDVIKITILSRRVQLFLVRNELLKTKWMKRMAINPESKSMSKKFTINTIG